MTRSEAAIKRGVSGFLKPRRVYCVWIGAILMDHSGHNKRDAIYAFKRNQKWSQSGQGRAANQPITLTCDGQEIRKFTP
jgi:hypothetical protein